jgi:hypothetical protein
MRSLRAAVAGVASVAAIAGAVLLAPGAADAHHPEVDVSCISAAGMIRIAAVAWDAPTEIERLNDYIEIRFDGRVVHIGEFSRANNYSFTFDYDASGAAPGPHVVRATSVHGWGPDEADPDPIGIGAYREDTIVLPCATWPTTTTTTTSTSTTTTTTVAAPTTTAPVTTTTIAATVGGVVELRPEPAVAVPTLPRFAG